MKRLIVSALMALFAAPAIACVPPPGLSAQQWYSMCRNDMEDGYARGFGGNQSHDAFMASMYRMYQSSHPTYNPVIQQQQQQLANTMASRQQQYMASTNQRRDSRNAVFEEQQRQKAWQQNQTMMYIQNEHCAIWDSAHTYCLKVAN